VEKDGSTRNITLALPDRLLRRARIVAVERRTSLSGLLREVLEDLVDRDDGTREARDRSVIRLQDGFDLGTRGNLPWTRDELHAR